MGAVRTAALVLALAVVLPGAGCSYAEPAPRSPSASVPGASAAGPLPRPTRDSEPLPSPLPTAAATWDAARYPAGRYPGRAPRHPYASFIAGEYSEWAAGKAWKVTGGGFNPGAKLQLYFGPEPGLPDAVPFPPLVAGRAVTADSRGRYAATFFVPADAVPGGYTLSVQDLTSGEVSRCRVHVVAR